MRTRLVVTYGRSAALVAVLLAACARKPAPQRAAPAVIRLGPENVAVVERHTIQSGPAIAGALRPRNEATVRAEVGGQIVESVAEAGVRVRRGEVVARIQDGAFTDQLAAAEQAVRSATSAVEIARRNHERARTLSRAGAIATRDAEQAEITVAIAEAQLADAKARVAAAEQMLARLRARAPFDGVVQDRHANPGDIVQAGAALYTIVDPSRLRLEAFVPAEFLGDVRVGSDVDFEVTGYRDRTFRGRIEQVSPSVDRATGQVRLFAEIPNPQAALAAGLFARGRIVRESVEALVLPIDAVDATGSGASVLRVRDGSVERVPVALGIRDQVSDRVEVRSGIAMGDVVLRGSGRSNAGEGAAVALPQQRSDAPAG